MKNIFLTVLLFAGLVVSAQKNERFNNINDSYTPEQQAELRVKQMQLSLNLNENQVQKVKELELKMAKERQAIREKNRTDRELRQKKIAEKTFERKNQNVDRRLAHQEELKKILNAEQFEKWTNQCNNQVNQNMGRSREYRHKGYRNN